MRKQSASGVLARHCRLTVSAAFTNVTRVIPRVVNLRGSPYGTSTIRLFARCGLAGRPFCASCSYSDTNTRRELIAMYGAKSEFFRNLLVIQRDRPGSAAEKLQQWIESG